ncbi:hypothetical protein [Azospirillum sp. TSO22-1]|uniref:hypothetical protein n=1 Tax=Azospirillum sp. TSO22-1 TaxID=716789 RepID=UPI000D6055DD|nr:hypothetical protein [Azospirillum sp. TSO22-1]PWC54538.1 hypothetical protein TSO221_07765 [Azospirillum sp. TSO22-1]
MTQDIPERKPDTAKDKAPKDKADITMPPRCDEYSGGGGSFPDTRNRAEPGHRNGDCDRIGNAPD